MQCIQANKINELLASLLPFSLLLFKIGHKMEVVSHIVVPYDLFKMCFVVDIEIPVQLDFL